MDAAIAEALARGEDLAVVGWLIDHLAGASGFHARLRGSPAGLAIMTRFQRQLRALLGHELARQGRNVAESELEFLMGGIFAVAEAWMERGCDEDPGALKRRLKAMVRRQLG